MTTGSAPAARMRVGIVGAGRCGSVLGAALARVGHRPVGVTAVSDASRERARVLLPGVPIAPAPEVVAEADLALLAVPDEVLPGLVAGLAAAGAFHPGQVLLHTSPGWGIGVLEAAGADVLPLALHPALALSGLPGDVDRLAGAVAAVTTLTSLRPLGEALAIEMGADPVWVEEEDRVAYAAALAAVREGLEGVLGAAARVLADCGIPDPRRALTPLVGSTLEAAFGSSVSGGPALRGPRPLPPHPTPVEPEEPV